MKNIVLILLLLCSCSPLKRVQRSEQKQEVITDKSLVELVSVEIQRQVATLNQTKVEFYPPISVYSVDTLPTMSTTTTLSSQNPLQKGKKAKESVQCQTLPTITTLPNQPIKSITTTQIATRGEQISHRDSTIAKDIVHSIDTDYTEKTVEKPPAAVQWIKWAAIALIVILIILIVIKL